MKKSGFTLIEVLVATTVMMLLVAMIGALFRQATSSWDTGRARGEGGMVVRGVVGAIAADLATAIDGRPYDSNVGLPSGNNGLTFVCLKPTVDGNSRKREVHKIHYSVGTSVTRHDAVWNGTGWTDLPESKLYDDSASSGNVRDRDYRYDISIETKALDMPGNGLLHPGQYPQESRRDYEDDASKTWTPQGPASVKVRVTLSQEKSFSGLTVRSLGRNGFADEDERSKEPDDILVR